LAASHVQRQAGFSSSVTGEVITGNADQIAEKVPLPSPAPMARRPALA
jgi:hypothetical protein